MITLYEQRRAEIEKYERAYKHPNYRMGDQRKMQAQDNILSVSHECKTYLDVGCGRGEMVAFAADLGMEATGLEMVSYLVADNVLYGNALALPYDNKSHDLVTMYDVIEHLLPDDTEQALRELNRVAKRHVFLTANNKPSRSLGEELHVNKRPYPEWDRIIRQCFDGQVTWLSQHEACISETWRISW